MCVASAVESATGALGSTLGIPTKKTVVEKPTHPQPSAQLGLRIKTDASQVTAGQSGLRIGVSDLKRGGSF